MGRPVRIHLPDQIYHILNRGNNRQVIFATDEDYQHYLDVIKRYKEKYGFSVFAYCLMSNHVHLLIQTTTTGNISRIMQSITISHTRYYHYTYKSSGHVWQGRFKSPMVSSDEYLLTVIQYIEQNPVRAGIVDQPGKYKWSSFPTNALGKNDGLTDREKNPIYLTLGNTLKEQQVCYNKIAQSLLSQEETKEIRRSLTGQGHYLSERFEAEIRKKLNARRRRPRGRPKKQGTKKARIYI